VEQAEPKNPVSADEHAIVRIRCYDRQEDHQTQSKGIARTLLEQLTMLSKNQELRLSQAAGYTHQALLGIPNDEALTKRFGAQR